MGVEVPAAYTVLTGLIFLAGLLIRVLVRSDARWERILAAQVESAKELERQRDHYRALWESCMNSKRGE